MTATTSLKTITIAGLLGLAVSATGALAYGENQIASVQAREAAAIERGRYSGELTRREYRDLKAEQQPTIKEDKPKIAATQLRGLKLGNFLDIVLLSMNATFIVRPDYIEVTKIGRAHV